MMVKTRTLLRPVEKVVRHYLRRRQNMVVYSAATVLCMTLTIVTCRILVPQSHIQERLAIWWAMPYTNPASSSVDTAPGPPDPYLYATGRQLLDRVRIEPAASDPTVELHRANTLKRDIFSEEAYDVRLQGGKSRGSSSRVSEVVMARSPPRYKKHGFKDLALTLEERVDDLVNRMTLEEVVAQSRMVQGEPTPGVRRLGVKPFWWTTDCSNGLPPKATSFPENLGLAAAFSPDLVRNVSNAMAIEMRAWWKENRGRNGDSSKGLNCFGPSANLMRHPLWGGNKETFGEDPYLTGQMTNSYVSGLQGNHPRYVRVAAGCKHFAAHSGPDPSQGPLDIKLSERDFQMTYLPPFRACVLAGVQSIMCSNNRVNGQSACNSRQLLTTMLRDEWLFNGFVAAQSSPGGAQDPGAAAQRVKAGCNMEVLEEVKNRQKMPVSRGNLTLEELRDSIKPILRVRMRLGEFDPPTMTPYSDIVMTPVQRSKHREQAMVAAMMSFVLLKNDNQTLPLKSSKKYKKVAVVGPFSNYALSGSDQSKADKEYADTPLEGLSRWGPTAHADGCKTDCRRYDAKGVQNAVSGADVVFVCLGTAEAGDRKDLELPGKQLQLLQDVTKWKGKARLVLLLFSGGPVDISWSLLAPGVNAILYCFLPGTGAGDAIWRILTRTGRKSSPAGRLPFTWPIAMTQVAPMTEYSMAGRTYRYLTSEPLLPFGYGLSYSTFNYTSLSIYPKVISPGKDITVTIGIQNLGPYGAEEIVQLYMHWGAVAALAPKLQLVGYRRVYLNVGPAVTFDLKVKAEQMAIWIDNHVKFAILPGEMTFYVGGQQPFQKTKALSNILNSSFTITR